MAEIAEVIIIMACSVKKNRDVKNVLLIGRVCDSWVE